MAGLVITITLLVLAVVNAVFVTWATGLDARHSWALARALGATPQQVSAGLSAAQVFPALAGAILGIPGGIALIEAVDPDPTIAPLWQLLAVVPGTVLLIAALTAIPARISTRRPRRADPSIRTRLTLRRFIMGLLATKTRMFVARLLVLGTLAATVAACGDSDDHAGAAATTGTKSPASTAAQTAPGTAAPGDQAWKRVTPGGDCQCSDGSEFSFWMRRANPKKVVLYLQDGGACFSAKTCAPERDLYEARVNEGPIGQGGIFDFADERNPFADHSFVYVPYCTGDVHIGNTSAEYAPSLTVQHKGYVNGSAALDHLAATFPDATDVVVIGESAGSIAAPLYAGLVSDRLPDARITVLADGSGAYPDTPVINGLISAWASDTAIPRWPENPRLGPGQWSFPGLFIQSGRHDQQIMFARHDYAYDAEQDSKLSLVGIPAGDLLARIDANETQIEDAGVNLLSYIAPGDEHTVLSDGPFYAETVNGEKLVDWVTRLIEGKPVDDVHCRECRAD